MSDATNFGTYFDVDQPQSKCYGRTADGTISEATIISTVVGRFEDFAKKYEPKIQVTLDEGAICPTRGTSGSAGLDLYALEDTYIGHNATLVKTGVRMAIPGGMVGIIKDRSSLALKQNVTVSAGVIDSDYRSTIGVVMTCKKIVQSTVDGRHHLNVSHDQPLVKKGERIAQLLIVPVCMWDCQVVESLDSTVRGEGGFGSTGK